MVGKFTDTIEGEVDDFFTNGVVTTGIVVSSIFFTVDELFWVPELTIGSGTDFINDGGLEIDHDGTGDVLAGSGFGEESVEGIIANTDGLIGWHLTIWLNSVL